MIKARHPLLLLYAICLHYTWAVLIWCDGAVATVTAVSGPHEHFGAALPVVLVLCSSLTIAAMMIRRTLWTTALMLPQQTILLISTEAAVKAMARGAFADGVHRSVLFLVADQAPALLATVFFTVALITNSLVRDG